jgi:hypothetical protein
MSKMMATTFPPTLVPLAAPLAASCSRYTMKAADNAKGSHSSGGGRREQRFAHRRRGRGRIVGEHHPTPRSAVMEAGDGRRVGASATDTDGNWTLAPSTASSPYLSSGDEGSVVVSLVGVPLSQSVVGADPEEASASAEAATAAATAVTTAAGTDCPDDDAVPCAVPDDDPTLELLWWWLWW